MSLRDEVLGALTDHPGGLTSKEIAKHCPACEFCPLTVGSMVATLKREGVIYPDGFGAGGDTRYKFGTGPKAEPVNEPALSMSSRSQKFHPFKGRPFTPPPQTAPEHGPESASSNVRVAAPQEPRMEPRAPLPERVIAALRAHGPLTLAQLAERVRSTVGSLSTIMGTLQKTRGVQKRQGTGRGAVAIYYPPGAKLEGDALAAGAELGRRESPKRVNGAEHPKAPLQAEPLVEAVVRGGAVGLGAVLASLRDKRAEAADVVQKIDRAIEALEALA